MINHVLHVFTLALYSLHVNTGSIKSVSIKGSKTGWLAMSRGANWQSNAYLDCQSLSFSITTTDGATRVFLNVVPSSWSFGQTYSSRVQF
uniref:Expansin n=1 Tax=Brassica oleracea var. oleracea TaxID=109376 RepID=A0A0D3CDW2_BRAOL